MKSKYKHVYPYRPKTGKIIYYNGSVSINGTAKQKSFSVERDAAIFVDTALIEAGKEPVNILKKKSN